MVEISHKIVTSNLDGSFNVRNLATRVLLILLFYEMYPKFLKIHNLKYERILKSNIKE